MRSEPHSGGSPRQQTIDRGMNTHPPGKLFRPLLVVLAVVLNWAALNQPPLFTPASLLVWLLGAITVGLLVRAALALAIPIMQIGMARVATAVRLIRNKVEEQ